MAGREHCQVVVAVLAAGHREGVDRGEQRFDSFGRRSGGEVRPLREVDQGIDQDEPVDAIGVVGGELQSHRRVGTSA